MKKLIFVVFLSLFFAGMESFAQTAINATISFQGATASGTYRVYRSPFNNNLSLTQVQKPIILVEGFDPNGDFDIPELYDFLNPPGNSVADQLHAAGHDIIILNFDDGGDFIQRNAFLVQELIEQVNAQKPNNDPVVVVGFSMGGLVARYALTHMEESNINHETVLYVSFDSPHKGAHIPLGIQSLANNFDSPVILQLVPDLQESLAQFNSPAARQMLKYRIESAAPSNGEIPVSQDHLDFLEEIEGQNDCNGFPSQCRNVGIALGSWNGIGQRSALDVDNNGVNDLQHSAMPAIYINFPESDGNDDVQLLWELNTCESIAAFGFQAFLSTPLSNNYPHFDDRFDYAGLENFIYATSWYSNQLGLPPLPGGAWSRFWSHPNFEPIDIAPGGFVNTYGQLLNGLNSQVECSFALIESSNFVPTVSALAFNTDDMFHNILGDADRLAKTPFDEIIGVTGDNRRHDDDVTADPAIVSFIVNEITTATATTTVTTTCAKELEQVSGTVFNGQTVLIDEVSVIEASNYTIKSGATVDFKAGESINLLPGFIVENGASYNGMIVPCSPKACVWEKQFFYELTLNVNTACFANGLATAVVGNGVPPYTFTWSNGNVNTTSSSSDTQFGIGNGIYSVTVTDDNGVSKFTSFSLNCFGSQLEERVAQDNPSDFNLVISPNPTTDRSTLIYETGKAGYSNIELYNLSGTRLKHVVANQYREAGTYQEQIDLTTYPSGVYLLKIQHEDQVEMRKIILK